MATRSMRLGLLLGWLKSRRGWGMGLVAALVRADRRSARGSAAVAPSCDGGLLQQLGHPEQVVGAADEVCPQSGPLTAAVAGLAQPTDRLGPAEDLLDPLPTPLTDRIPGMPRRAGVDHGAAVPGDALRDVRRDPQRTHVGDELLRIVRFVATDRRRTEAAPPQPLEQLHRFRALGGRVGVGDTQRDAQPMAILHHDVRRMAELRLLAVPL